MLPVFLGLELMSIPIYVLAGFDRRKLRSNESAMKYFLIGSFASAILLYGIALLYGVAGTHLVRRDPRRVRLRRTRSRVAGLGARDRRLRVQDLVGAVPPVDARRLRGRAVGGDGLHVASR